MVKVAIVDDEKEEVIKIKQLSKNFFKAMI